MSFGAAGVAPVSSRATAAAHVFACEFAANADFGIPPAMAASLMTCTFACSFDSNVTDRWGTIPCGP